MKLLVLMKTILVLTYLVTALLVTLPYIVYVNFSKNRWILADRYIKALVRSAVFLLGIRYEFRGEPMNPAPTLYIGNHTSNIDVAVAIAAFPTPNAFIAKREMRKIPVLKWWMQQLGCVFIDRSQLRQQVKALKTAQDNMSNGLSYLVFPEGTRSHTHSLLEFKPGAFRIATKTDTPIQPIGFSGFGSIMKKGSMLIHSGKVIINVGKPIRNTAEYDKDSPELTRILRNEVRRLVEEVEGEGSYPFAEESDSVLHSTESGENLPDNSAGESTES